MLNDFSEYMSLSLSIVKDINPIVLEFYSQLNINTEWKNDGTPVTIADKKVNNLVIERIREKFPEHSIQGEEQSFIVKQSEYVWICDPIDGTIPFSLGMPFFSFSLALVKNETPILGIVSIPFMNEIYFAELGSGAYLNGERIFVKNSTSITKDSYFFTENWGGSLFDTTGIIKKLVYDYDAKVFQLLSVVYAGIMVAKGKCDGVIFPGQGTHDVASISIIIQEAGGIHTDIKGENQLFGNKVNGFICSGGNIHNELVSIVNNNIIPR